MEQYDAIIIGGGHNGLLTGAYLAKAGVKVLIIERRWETGGAVMTDEQSGCRLNTHACYMMMMDKAPVYEDLQLAEYGCTRVRLHLYYSTAGACLFNQRRQSLMSL